MSVTPALSALAAAALAAAALSRLLTGLVAGHAEKLGLVSLPNHRSSHVRPTPSGGGLGIVLAALAVALPLLWGRDGGFLALLAASLPLALVGLLDDVRPLPARLRVLVQLAVVAALVVLAGGLWIPGGVLAWLWAGGLLLAGMWWINLFNFMDGIDGIAGAQALVMLMTGAGLAESAHAGALASPAGLVAVCAGAAVVGYLPLNWPPARIFMGDVGSTWLAFIILAVALTTIRAGWLGYGEWLILAALFVTDATVTLATRLLRGEKWYEAHRSHAYQILSRRWAGTEAERDRKVGHRAVTLLALAINILWLAPLAGACLKRPDWSIAWVALAYAPLVAGALLLKAGKPDHA